MSRDFGISLRMKDFFFDRQTVERKMKKANRRALSKAGAFIRRRARSSLRRRRKASAAGKPPSVHTRDRHATLKNILFAYDAANESLVVGPVLLDRQSAGDEQLVGATVPELQELGGAVRVRQRPRKRSNVRRVRAVRYPARPFMGPALEAEKDNIPDAWSGELGG